MPELTMTYRVWLTNFGWALSGVFAHVDDALASGRAKGFEFAVCDARGNVIASWSPISGLAYHYH